MNKNQELLKEKQTNEMKALVCGIVLNLLSTIAGFIFFGLTLSMSIFLDALISGILCCSTVASVFVSNAVNKKKTNKYPLGRYAIENIFLLFRSIMMLGTIIFTIFDGAQNIAFFIRGEKLNVVNMDNIYLISYCALMVFFCLLITISYSFFNKKAKSEIIKIEIKASIYDGLVTLFAISSLLIFANVEGLKFMAPIGDSITVIILSVFYTYSPVKELIHQISILTDRRRFPNKEKKMLKNLSVLYPEYKYVDIYYSFSGNTHSIYISLYPLNDKTSVEITDDFDLMRSQLHKKYPNSIIYLLLSSTRLHKM